MENKKRNWLKFLYLINTVVFLFLAFIFMFYFIKYETSVNLIVSLLYFNGTMLFLLLHNQEK